VPSARPVSAVSELQQWTMRDSGSEKTPINDRKTLPIGGFLVDASGALRGTADHQGQDPRRNENAPTHAKRGGCAKPPPAAGFQPVHHLPDFPSTCVACQAGSTIRSSPTSRPEGHLDTATRHADTPPSRLSAVHKGASASLKPAKGRRRGSLTPIQPDPVERSWPRPGRRATWV
jgi:hypothetical protein